MREPLRRSLEQTRRGGPPSPRRGEFMGWYSREVARGHFNPRAMPGTPSNPLIAVNSESQRQVPVGSFFLDSWGDTFWQGPGGPRLAGRTGNGSPMVRSGQFGRAAAEAGMHVDAAVRGAADNLSFGTADELEAARGTLMSGRSPSRWRQTFHDLHQEQLARDDYDIARRGLARNIGSTAGFVASLAGPLAATKAPRAISLARSGLAGLGRSAAINGTIGALTGAAAPAPGQSRLRSATTGAAVGAVFGVGGEYGGRVVARHAPAIVSSGVRLVEPHWSQLSQGYHVGQVQLPIGHGLREIPTDSNAMREEARALGGMTEGIRASQLGDYVEHHRIPLRYQHLFPMLYPNRISNIQRIHMRDHVNIVNPMWDQFHRNLGGREPTAAEVLRQAIVVDRAIAGRIVSRSRSTARHSYQELKARSLRDNSRGRRH